ncbi:OmpH family outer membrane protein [Antarctobacter jejuensis]|uniref:OmpH family outer membrane protein n=1 Tax=Antarctobacter jejuensis TaxID=1439938 RepID=UPI003FD086CB
MRLTLRILTLALALMTGAALSAQQTGPFTPGVVRSPILVIDFERVFDESAFGRRVNDDIEREGSAIAAENRKIEAELIEEERELTDLRATLPPSEFRALADAFDEKVQRLREEQDAKARALGTRTEEERRRFLSAVQPVIEDLLREAGAAIILERRSVFVAADAIDVTDRAITLIDAEVGAGAAPETPDPPPAPDPAANPAPAPQD